MRPSTLGLRPRNLRALGLRLAGTAILLTLALPPAALFADDGDLDPTFGDQGQALYGVGSAVAIVSRPDGSLRLGVDRISDQAILALDANGEIDEDFGDDGEASFTIRLDSPYANQMIAMFERANGKLLIVSNIDTEIATTPALLQVTAAGNPDATFGTDGVRMISVNFQWDWATVYDAAMQSDGKVVLVGACVGCLEDGLTDSFVARFDTQGAPDATFGTNGWVAFDADEISDRPNFARAVAIDTSGRLVVGGTAGYDEEARPYVARRLSGGGADPSFAGSNGISTLVDIAEQGATALAIDPVSKAIFAATGSRSNQFPENAAVARLTNSGLLDGTWSGDGVYPLSLEEGTHLSQLLIQSDGKIAAVGTINANGPQIAGFLLARFRSNGTLDTTFDGNGLKRLEFDVEANASDFPFSATLSGGRILAVGTATSDNYNRWDVAVLRTESALVYRDGFERGNDDSWDGN